MRNLLTIEKYIEKRKKEEKINEFDFKHHSQNMSSIISFVSEYFNDYLDIEKYSYEEIKLEQALVKIEKELSNHFPLSKQFILEFYRTYSSRIDRIVKNWLKSSPYWDLFYSDNDYKSAIATMIEIRQYSKLELSKFENNLVLLAREVTNKEREKPTYSEMMNIDPEIVKWVRTTYKDYGVNLLCFISEIMTDFYLKNVKWIYSRYNKEQSYSLIDYNYKYVDNVFNIDEIYEDNCARPFIEGKKGELEMLMMDDWLESIKDRGYWAEYVNLCIEKGKVNLSSNVNIIYPVEYNGIKYPPDIDETLTYYETKSGLLDKPPSGKYVLRLIYPKDDDSIWKDPLKFNDICKNLRKTITEHGAPYAFEFDSPIRDLKYNENEFISFYKLIEKEFRKHKNTAISIVNGKGKINSRRKTSYLVQSVEYIQRLNEIAKRLNLRLKLSLNIDNLIRGCFSLFLESMSRINLNL